MKRIRFAVVLLVLAAALTACQGKISGYEGTIATQEERIALKSGGPHEGRWQDDNLIVDYQYFRKPDTMTVEGTVRLTRRLTGTFRMVQNFSVRANLLTAEGKIVKSLVIVVVGNSVIRPWTFKRTTECPPEVTAMNFSYRGRASEGTRGMGGLRRSDGVSTSFWKNP